MERPYISERAEAPASSSAQTLIATPSQTMALESAVPGWSKTNNVGGQFRTPRRPPDAQELLVSDVMGGLAPTVPEQLTVSAARKIANLKHTSWLFVGTDGSLLGILDVAALPSAADGDLVSVHTKPIALGLRPTSPASIARGLLRQHGLPCLPVTVGKFLVGTVSREAVDGEGGRPIQTADALFSASGRAPRSMQTSFENGNV
jgi:CBS domain-containing protein